MIVESLTAMGGARQSRNSREIAPWHPAVPSGPNHRVISASPAGWPSEMSFTMQTYLRSLWTRTPVAPLLCALFGLTSGYLAVREPKLAAALIGFGVVLALIARSPIAIAVLVAPASFNVSRLSIGHGIALPDAVLLVATVLSLPALARLARLAESQVSGDGSPSTWLPWSSSSSSIRRLAALMEVFHRTLLVDGAVGVGAWLYLAGQARLALRLLVGVATCVGAVYFIFGAAHGFASTAYQPFGLNKNYAGSVLGLSMLMVLAAPGELDLQPTWRYAALAAMSGGLIGSHSRAAMVGLAVGIIVWFLRTHSDYRKRSFVIGSVLCRRILDLCELPGFWPGRRQAGDAEHELGGCSEQDGE